MNKAEKAREIYQRLGQSFLDVANSMEEENDVAQALADEMENGQALEFWTWEIDHAFSQLKEAENG